MNNIHFAFGKYLSIFIHYYVITILGRWNTKYMSQLYNVEQGKNADRSDACDL